MTFARSMFGYDKEDVDRRIKDLEEEMTKAKGELAAEKERLKQIEADAEEYKVTIASMRRQRLQVHGGAKDIAPVTVMVGPSTALSQITRIMDDLDSCELIDIRFRVFRDGFYRVDGFTQDLSEFKDWLRDHADVRSVMQKDEAVHVIPKGKFE